jgi:hypothetical protein
MIKFTMFENNMEKEMDDINMSCHGNPFQTINKLL